VLWFCATKPKFAGSDGLKKRTQWLVGSGELKIRTQSTTKSAACEAAPQIAENGRSTAED
jgi:hypothetical protein